MSDIKLHSQQLAMDVMPLDLAGPSMHELREATALLIQKYGAFVSFVVDVETANENDVRAFFLERKLLLRFTKPSPQSPFTVMHCENGAP